MAANWKRFKEWDTKDKKTRLSELSLDGALRIYNEFFLLQESLLPQELEQIHQRRLENLISWRRIMDSLKEKLR